jgi:hypothetical protein
MKGKKMLKIMYGPEQVGKEVMNNRGKLTTIRKYHMTEEEMALARKKWEKEIEGVPKKVVKQAGKHFFNPYRRGIYYYQIYSIFMLGANRWHSLSCIIDKMEEIMSKVFTKRDGIEMSSWERFKGKNRRSSATRCKDFIGRIQENMIFFQRLNKLHPTGFKLRQVFSAVDMKRTSKNGFPQGCFFYRLSTYNTINEALPKRDFSRFKFPKHESKYVGYKFIGTIVTKDRVIREGEIDDMSSVQSG